MSLISICISWPTCENPKTTFLSEKFANSKGLQSTMKAIVNPISLFAKEAPENEEHEDKNDKYKLCWPFTGMTKYLLGTENDRGGKGRSGVRNYLLRPLFELLSLGNLKTPLYYLDKNNNIVVEFEEHGVKLAPQAAAEQKEPVEKANGVKGTIASVGERIDRLERKTSRG